MTDFPFHYDIFLKMLDVFKSFRGELIKFFPLVFLFRVIFSFITFKNTNDFMTLLKDTFILWGLFYFFYDFVIFSVQIPSFLSSTFQTDEIFEVILEDNSWFTFFTARLGSWFAVLSYWISFGLYIFMISLFILFSPFVFFMSSSLSSYGAFKVFLSSFIFILLWPIFWYGINFTLVEILLGENAFVNHVILILGNFLKVIFPLFFIGFIAKFSLVSKLGSVAKGVGLVGASKFANNKTVQTIKAVGGDHYLTQASKTFHQAKKNLYKKLGGNPFHMKNDITHTYNHNKKDSIATHSHFLQKQSSSSHDKKTHLKHKSKTQDFYEKNLVLRDRPMINSQDIGSKNFEPQNSQKKSLNERRQNENISKTHQR